jgi:DNA-binding transcriptional MerR regulator
MGLRIIRATVGGDLAGALELAHGYRVFVQVERAQAEAAADVLERWAFGASAEAIVPPLQIGQVARLLDVTIDVLHNWDRNGLIDVPRDPSNGYRRYGVREIRRLRVIRLLSRAGYSLSAILRMLLQLDRGETADLRRALDTPRPDEDIVTARDRWLSTLADQERRAQTTIALLDEIIRRGAAGDR